MALVKCPECGRENVSDSAESCPNCGYNIKKHYEKTKQEKRQQISKLNINHEPNINVCPECKKEFSGDLRICPHCGLSLDDKESIQRLNTMRILESKSNSKTWWKRGTVCLISLLIIAILLFVMYIYTTNGLLLTGVIFALFFTCVSIYSLYSDYSSKEKAKAELDLAKKDYDKYKAKKDKEREAAKIQSAINSARKAAKHPKCPNCGSTNTFRITTAGRMASVAAVGIASGKIGKQYECKNCKYKW